jgi:hypothetical protein
MNGYHVDWVGALAAGVASAIVFLVLRRVFSKLTGAPFYIVLGLAVAVASLAVRELLRYVGI